MNLAEFKAWFDGYTEDMSGPPNEDQWAKIKAKVNIIGAVDYPAMLARYNGLNAGSGMQRLNDERAAVYVKKAAN